VTPANAHVLHALRAASGGTQHGNDGFGGGNIELFEHTAADNNDTDTEEEGNIDQIEVFDPRQGDPGHF
jgi:hypothetical protein